jgi:hypothetical protein
MTSLNRAPIFTLFDILHYTFLRPGDVCRFGPPHLRQIVRKMAVQIATGKSRGNTAVTAAGASAVCGKPAGGALGRDNRRGRVLPMNKKAYAANMDDFTPLPDANRAAANGENRALILRLHFQKKA